MLKLTMIDYILKTLQREDHVFIERLGAFRLQLKHAQIDKDTVRPPYNEVVFSQTDSEENNFALANQISREQQCLFTQANEQITAWVGELLTALQNNKSVTYEDFGTFMLDKKGNITFESAIIPQLNSQFEGMEPIDLKRFGVAVPVVEQEPDPQSVREPECVKEDTHILVDSETEPVEEMVEAKEDAHIQVDGPQSVREPECANDDAQIQVDSESEPVEEIIEAKEDVHIQVKPEPVVEPDEEVDDDEDDDEDEYEDEDEEPEKKKHHLAWLWILLLLIAVLAALGFVFKDKLLGYYHQWKEKKQPVEQVVEPQETPETTATVEEVAEPAEPEQEPQEMVEEPAQETYTPAVIKQSSDGKYDYIRFEKGHYYVIAGSFPNESDVIRHIRQKNLDQYSPKILKQDGVSNLRVCIGVFDTESEAESFAKGVSSSYWVLK